MKRLIIGFSKPQSKLAIVSAIIRLIQGTKFSHVFFKIENDNMRNSFFYHASGTKVNFMNSKLFYKKNDVVKAFALEITEEGFYRFLDAAIDRVGSPYSILQLFGNFLLEVFHLRKNPLKTDGFICTELVADILSEVKGFRFSQDKEVIDLKDIYNYMTRTCANTLC